MLLVPPVPDVGVVQLLPTRCWVPHELNEQQFVGRGPGGELWGARRGPSWPTARSGVGPSRLGSVGSSGWRGQRRGVGLVPVLLPGGAGAGRRRAARRLQRHHGGVAAWGFPPEGLRDQPRGARRPVHRSRALEAAMTDTAELVDLPDPAVRLLVRPLDLRPARPLFRRLWLVGTLTSPPVAFCAAALVWSPSQSYVAAVAVGVALVGVGAWAGRCLDDEPWAFIPRRRQDRRRPLPVSWELASACSWPGCWRRCCCWWRPGWPSRASPPRSARSSSAWGPRPRWRS